jgi:pimeloyl-ACP methyl ester carboxylesterase
MATMTLVYVHGLGGSAHNWALLSPLLARFGPARSLDLAGFGLRVPSRPGATTVADNAELLHRFLVEEVGEPAVLVGNSMGCMVSFLLAADHPELVGGLVLIDPTLPLATGAHTDPEVRKLFLAQAIPGFGEMMLRRRLATVPARQRVAYTLRLCCVDPSRIPPSYVDEMVALEEERARVQPDRAGSHLAASRSILRRLARPSAYWATMASITAPVLLLHGVHDRLVPIASARAAAARFAAWSFAELDAGHIPHMETPALVADHVAGWLPGLGL